MVKETGAKAFLDIYEYFRYKNLPSDSQIDQWCDKIRFIPEESVSWIVRAITDLDRLPPNLPKEFVRQWYAYRKANPDKVATKEYKFCKDCFGHGTHLFRKTNHFYDPPIKTSYVAICAACGNWQKSFDTVVSNGGRIRIENKPIGQYVEPMMKTTRREIEQAGYEYLPQRDPRARAAVPSRDAVKLVEGIG